MQQRRRGVNAFIVSDAERSRRKGKKTSSWRLWSSATIRDWQRHIARGGAAWLGKMQSTSRFGRMRVLGLDYPRTLASMTDAEARADGALADETAVEWKARNHRYFKAEGGYCKVTFVYLG